MNTENHFFNHINQTRVICTRKHYSITLYAKKVYKDIINLEIFINFQENLTLFSNTTYKKFGHGNDKVFFLILLDTPYGQFDIVLGVSMACLYRTRVCTDTVALQQHVHVS